MSRRFLAAVAIVVAAGTATACGAGSAPVPTAGASTSSVPATTGRQAATAGTVPAAEPPVNRLRGVGGARQLVVVTAPRYGTSAATVTAYRKTSTGWTRVFGPWSARIGYNGFAPPHRKREGDGRTPTGSYHFSFFFGAGPRPSGLRFAWHHAHTYDVWDDDSSSARYNLWTDRRRHYPGRSPEPLHVRPTYDLAAVIAYNTARTPGLGSAIFLHVSHVGATSGCVSLPRSDVLRLLRWLDPHRAPRIIMGTTGAITR